MTQSVLPKALFKTFFSEFNAIYGQEGFKAGFANLKDRLWLPLADRCRFSYFASPYRSVGDFGWNFLAGPVAGFGSVLVPYVSVTLLIIPALGELLMSLSSFAKSLFYLCKGDTKQAGAYFRDGLMRFMLAPCLAILCVVAVPFEVVRFIVRCISSLVHAVKSCFTPTMKVADVPSEHAEQADHTGATLSPT